MFLLLVGGSKNRNFHDRMCYCNPWRLSLTIFIMKKILLIPALILTLLIGQVANAAFSDVDDGTPYGSSIGWMNDNGVIQGYDDGTFKPDQCVNRAEFLKMMYLASKTDIIVEDGFAGSNYYDNFFTDTYTDQWYWPYVEQALRDKAIEGYPDGTFKPEQCVNRAEAIKMAVLGFWMFNEDAAESRGENIYRDAVPGENWFDDYLYSAVDANAVGKDHVTNVAADSMPEVYFHPGESMTRKEVAEMLYRMKTLTDNEVFGYVETMAPDNLNYYISPSSGVSFLMPEGWWVIHDGYYETPGGAVADYPTILINGPTEAGEETVGINQRMMQCDGEGAATCFDINDNYKIGVLNPSAEALQLMNRILLTFRDDGIISAPSEIAFDGCGVPSSYSQEDWWTTFVGTWDAYVLTLDGSFPQHEALVDDFGDYCLALDKSMFIFIPAYYEDTSARIFNYDIINDVVEMAQADGVYNPQEFGARNGDYILVYGIDDYAACEYQVGNYYYLENRLETVVDVCAPEV